MKSIIFLRRMVMIILFIIAFYVTFTSITNVTLPDLYAIQTSTSQEFKLSKQTMPKRVVQLKYKQDVPPFRHQDITALESVMIRKEYPTKQVIATGYTAGIESTGKTSSHPEYGITFSGVEVVRDMYSTIAADLEIFPIGTILYIPDYGYGVVADKGSAIKGNKIDLYYQTVEDVYTKWGKKEIEVYVIEKGEGTLTKDQLTQLNNDEALKVFKDHE